MSLSQRYAFEKARLWDALQPTIHAGNLKIPAAPGVSQLIYRSPDWKVDMIRRVMRLRRGVFMDVGANIGQTLLDYVETGATGGYVGFEPNTRCVMMLHSIIKANSLSDAVVIPIGLSDVAAVVPFYVQPDRPLDTTATMLREIRPADAAETIFVPAYRFDDVYSDALSKREISLIKVDVEGGELNVLKGMQATLREQRPWVICEVLHRDEHADIAIHSSRCAALMSILTENGYRAYLIKKPNDERRFDGLHPIEAFPSKTYNRQNSHECDYLFAPATDDPVALLR